MVYSLPAAAKIRATHFRLQRNQALNPARGGQHQGVDMGEPLWVCELSTTALSHAQAGVYKYLRAKLRGALRTLYLYDAERPRPLAYITSPPSGAPYAWGTPMVTAISRTNSTITCSGFSAGAVISDGDYGHWDDGPARRLHICGAATANGSGVVTIPVEPAPPAAATATLPVAFTMEKASAEMVVMGFDAPLDGLTSQVSLRAGQILRRY